jgi:hypothetical protein
MQEVSAMPDEKQLALLRQDVEAWNQWRERYPDITISVAERSFPLLNLLEMLCQPHAQCLLHRWG